jgi:hypothetical protein
MKAIHGGKTKNDKIDSYKIAKLLMGGNFPIAYPYPAKMRATRDLLRRRTYMVRQCSLLVGHILNTNTQYNLPAFNKSCLANSTMTVLPSALTIRRYALLLRLILL